MEKSLRQEGEERELLLLHPRAFRSSLSAGRELPEEPDSLKNPFQIDRSRILLSRAFRRLKLKGRLPLLSPSERCHSRLSSVWECWDLLRTLCGSLRLNDSLAEAILFSRPLGHPPFGSAGESALSRLHSEGFPLQEQSLRVVEKLENQGHGLNLTKEVRDGIRVIPKRGPFPFTPRHKPSSLECQAVLWVEVFSPLGEELEELFRSGLLKSEDLPVESLAALGADPETRRKRFLVSLIQETRKNEYSYLSLEPSLADEVFILRDGVERALRENPLIQEETAKEERILEELFHLFLKNPEPYVDPFPPEERFETRIIDSLAALSDPAALALFRRLSLPVSWNSV